MDSLKLRFLAFIIFEQGFKKLLIKYLISQEWRLEKSEYKKYLYEKYRVTFSIKKLRFYFRGEEFQLNELMAKLHRIEQEKINLDYYVTAMFIVLIIGGYLGVSVLDAYLLSVHS